MASATFDTIRSLAFGSITGSYATLGAALAIRWRVFKISNNTDGDMFLSLDGVNDQMFVPAGGFTLYDISTNSPPPGNIENLVLPIGTQFYIRYSSAPTKGTVYIEGMIIRGQQ